MPAPTSFPHCCQWIARSLLTALLLLALPAWADQTFTASGKRFSLTLPDGWRLEPQKDQNIFTFNGQRGESVIVLFFPESTTSTAAFDQTRDAMKASLSDLTPESLPVDQQVNGQPARWASYSGTANAAGGKKIALIGVCGAVALRNSALGLLSFYPKNDPEQATIREKLARAVFSSIRQP